MNEGIVHRASPIDHEISDTKGCTWTTSQATPGRGHLKCRRLFPPYPIAPESVNILPYRKA